MRVAVPLPPRTMARPCLPVFTSIAVLPVATSRRNRSMSADLTSLISLRPSSGLMCRSIRPQIRDQGGRLLRLAPLGKVDVAQVRDCLLGPRLRALLRHVLPEFGLRKDRLRLLARLLRRELANLADGHLAQGDVAPAGPVHRHVGHAAGRADADAEPWQLAVERRVLGRPRPEGIDDRFREAPRPRLRGSPSPCPSPYRSPRGNTGVTRPGHPGKHRYAARLRRVNEISDL